MAVLRTLFGKMQARGIVTCHQKPLLPPAIAWMSKEGETLNHEAAKAGNAVGFMQLLANHTMQSELAFCGPASMCTVLNALYVDPQRAWKGPWRWFDEKMIADEVKTQNVETEGMAFDSFVEVARKFVHVDAFRAQHSSLEGFTHQVQKATSSLGYHMIISYSRKNVNQSGNGHFSPIAAYHPFKNMILLLDVARFKYPFHWLPLPLVWEAMNELDKETGQTRGFMVLSKKST